MKKKTQKRLTRTARAQILATAKANGWTADLVAKKFGVSKWAVYGWRKRGGTKRDFRTVAIVSPSRRRRELKVGGGRCRRSC